MSDSLLAGRSRRAPGSFRDSARPVLLIVVMLLAGLCARGHAVAEEPSPPPPDGESVAAAAHALPLVAGTPCTRTATACVDLESQRAWLLKDGVVVRGPVEISSGGPGEETPVGHSMRVYRKERYHRSQESRMPDGRPAPMPWSVFFAHGGIAFHSGDPDRASAGCVHLPPADARAWYRYLRIGDQVQVLRMSHEEAVRRPLPGLFVSPHEAQYGPRT